MQTFYKRENKKVNINNINEIMSENDFLIDLRSESEFREGTIPNSINVPFLHIKNWAKNNAKLDTRIYLYCQNGARSTNAASALKKLGYTNVIDLGGLNAYNGKLKTDMK